MYEIALIAVTALVIAATRFLPFLIFGEKRETPKIITYLGQVLPFAIMGMLVVYCLKDVSILEKLMDEQGEQIISTCENLVLEKLRNRQGGDFRSECA